MTKPYRVLAVDDEIMVKKTLRKLLDASDAFEWAGEAEDGAEALKMIESGKPDVLITDIRMPIMDGLELIQALDGRPDKPEIVILSGYDDFAYVHHAIRFGVADYLLKPIKPDQLYETMERVRERLETRSPEAPDRWTRLLVCESLARELTEQVWELNEAGVAALLDRLPEQVPAGAMRPFCSDLLQLIEAELAKRNTDLILEADRLNSIPEDASFSVLSCMREMLMEAMETVRGSRNWGSHMLVRRTKAYLERHYADTSLSMQHLAASLKVSPAYLSRIFKAETGMTLVQYVTGLRMERVRQLLEDPGISVQEAARRSGYADYPHFTKAFKRLFGLTPSEYRKRLGIQ